MIRMHLWWPFGFKPFESQLGFIFTEVNVDFALFIVLITAGCGICPSKIIPPVLYTRTIYIYICVCVRACVLYVTIRACACALLYVGGNYTIYFYKEASECHHLCDLQICRFSSWLLTHLLWRHRGIFSSTRSMALNILDYIFWIFRKRAWPVDLLMFNNFDWWCLFCWNDWNPSRRV